MPPEPSEGAPEEAPVGSTALLQTFEPPPASPTQGPQVPPESGMKSQPEEIKALLSPFLKALQDPSDFSEQSLFEGREALKAVFDRIDQRHDKALAQGFWSVQALVMALIRKGSIDQPVALKAIGGVVESLLDLMSRKPEETFSLAPPVGETSFAPIGSLKLAPLPRDSSFRSLPGSSPGGMPNAPVSKGSEIGRASCRERVCSVV